MRERPILFSAPMVRAILEGRKTQTRRIAKKVLTVAGPNGKDLGIGICPYGWPCDLLWVRETWSPRDYTTLTNRDRSEIFYRADDERVYESDGRWRPSIFMPRWASRITLEITEIRVQQLQDISEEDAKAEGVELSNVMSSYRRDFQFLWASINGADSWAANPWTWAISFKRIDAQERAA